MRDVVIIGAGPAGLSCAQALAERGRDVLVLEEHPTVGLPVHCTGVLGRGVFDELDLPRDAILGYAGSASFRAHDGLSVLIDSDHIVAAVIDRGGFDAALASRAKQAGAAIQTGVRVQSIEADDEAVVVRISRDHVVTRARACVLACGANYRLNRDVGLGVPRAYLLSAQIEVPFPAIPHIEVQFGRHVAPSGFAWTVPFRRDDRPYARLGLICSRDVRHHFHAYLADCARRAAADLGEVPRPRLKFLPLGPVERTYAARVLAVGDAAGLVKPTTGGGIYYGLLSGHLAAETLDEALAADTLGAGNLRIYETRWRERLGPEIRAGLAFRAIASRLNDRSIRALVELARVDGLVPLLKETADFNWHRPAALALLKHPSFRKTVLASFLS